MDALRAEAGTDKFRILAALLHVKTMDDFADMNAVWDAWAPKGAVPVRATVKAKLASPSLLFEATSVAAKD